MFRSHHVGRLVARYADGLETRAEDCHFVMQPGSTSLVFPVTRVMLPLDEHLLYVPEEHPPTAEEHVLEMMVVLAEEPPVSEASRERHLAYHGHIRGGVWITASIDTVRFGDDLFEGKALCHANTLAGCEARLCRRWNASKEKLRDTAHRRLGVLGGEALVVGVDQFGSDVRVGPGILRLEFSRPATCEEDACERIDELLAEGA